MELPNIFKKQDEEKPETYWSLTIDKSWVEAGVWCVKKDEVIVLATGTSSTWQEGDLESLVSAADSSMSSAATQISKGEEEPEKVVFGLHQSWLIEGDIKSERLDLLKKISQELELKPAGFVVLNEALSFYLKSQEGVLLNALLVGLGEDSVDLTLVQGGKIIGSTEIGKSMSLAADTVEGLAKIPNLPQYPARIILYDHRVADLENARQELLDCDWEKSGITFLHTPRVDILSEDANIAAISLAGGAEIAQATRVRFEEKTELAKGEVVGLIKGEEIQDKMIDNLNTSVKDDVVHDKDLDSDENLIEKEIVLDNETIEQAPVEIEKELEVVSPEELGFTSNVLNVPIDPQSVFTKKEVDPIVEPFQNEREKSNMISKLRNSIDISKWFLFGSSLGGKKRAMGIAGLVSIFVLIGLGLGYWFLPKAEVTLFVTPKRLEKTLEFSVSQDISEIDVEKKLIPGRIHEIKVSGEKTAQTTGVKTVGDKARGLVTIYRASKTSVILAAGTVLVGPNGLKFTLDEQVKVASGSGAANPSEQEGKVTAAMYGAEYNLAANTTFAVANYSEGDLQAENKAFFSGGSSREIAAVAEKDTANLESSLSDELLQKGIVELRNTLSQSDTLVESSVLLQKEIKNFNNKSGEEASTLKLKIEGKVAALVAPIEGVTQLVRASVEKDVPEGYTLKDDQIDVKYKNIPVTEQVKSSTKQSNSKEDAKTTNYKKYLAEVSANLLPKLNPDNISNTIAGKYPDVAKTYLATLPGFTRAEIDFAVKFPGKLLTLPRIPNNITVNIRAEE